MSCKYPTFALHAFRYLSLNSEFLESEPYPPCQREIADRPREDGQHQRFTAHPAEAPSLM